MGLVLMSDEKVRTIVLEELEEPERACERKPYYPHNRVVAKVTRLMCDAPLPPESRKAILEGPRPHDKPRPFYILPKIHKPHLAIPPNHSSTLFRSNWAVCTAKQTL